MLSYSFTSEDHQEDEELKCPKCSFFFSSITKPYILPCNHNICLNCIDSLISENNNKCPICNYMFNIKDRNKFEVNFGFLNLVIKILQTKIIYCTKCNKIFYWKVHYQICEQKYFENCDDILEEIKTNYEAGEKILKIIKKDVNLLNKCKKEIINLVNNIVNEINIKYKENTNNKINNELLKTNINIAFKNSKSEIIAFLKLCLPYSEYFNTKEILQILENTERKDIFLRKNRYFINKASFSPPSIRLFSSTEDKFYNINKNKKYETIVNNGIKLKKANFSNYNTYNESYKFKNNKQISTIYFTKRNKNDIISEEEYDDIDDNEGFILSSNMQDDEGINGSDRIKVKSYHDNNISQLKKINNNPKMLNIKNKNGILIRNVLFKSHKPNKKEQLKNINGKKKIKFDINSLLDQDINIEEEQTKNKIIVGLKDVKVISSKQTSSTINNSINNNYREIKTKKNSKLIKSKFLIPGKKIDLENMKNINNYNYKSNNIISIDNDNNTISKTIQNDTPSLSLLRSSDFTKREYRFHLIPKSTTNKNRLNNSIGYNYNSNTINANQSIDQSLSKINLNNSKYINNHNNNDFKILKSFNKIKDITNKLNKYNELINFLFNITNKNVVKNISLLKNIIKNNYDSLLNEIAYNLNHNQKNFLFTYINNTYNILIYDPFNRNYIIKNYGQIFKKNRININKFNTSMSIVYDDNDLIFITGGDHNYNLFIILTWSTGNIFHIEYMQTKKAFHKTIYFNENLYLIGGMTPNKKVSSECFYFNIKEKKWYLLPKLNHPRKNASLCFYNNTILYIFRGEDNNNVLDTIEYIDINEKKEWFIFKPIDYGYVWYPAKNSLIITIDRDKIIIGGGENNDGELFKDCFLFEPSTKCVYKGFDLITKSAFYSEGCFYQDEIFGIDFKNKTQNNKRIIHTYNTKKNIWNFSYIK